MWKLLRRLVLYPILGVSGCHMLVTGSPVPLWYVEQLDNPQQVATLSADALVLESGKRIALPYTRTLPVDNAVFLQAIQDGVEVGPDGEVVGLLEVHRVCGNDPVVYRKVRVNLSDLAGVLNPSGIDESMLHPEALEFIKASDSLTSHSVRVDGHVLWKMRQIRTQFEFPAEESTENRAQTHGRSGEHDRRTGFLLL